RYPHQRPPRLVDDLRVRRERSNLLRLEEREVVSGVRPEPHPKVALGDARRRSQDIRPERGELAGLPLHVEGLDVAEHQGCPQIEPLLDVLVPSDPLEPVLEVKHAGDHHSLLEDVLIRSDGWPVDLVATIHHPAHAKWWTLVAVLVQLGEMGK